MRHPILLAVGAAVLASLPVTSQAQGIRFHGIPASATSIGPNGELHGIPSSVTSPTFDNQNQTFFFNGNGFNSNGFNGTHFGQRRMVAPQFRHHRGTRVIAVPVYVPGYSLPYYAYEPEPVAQEAPPADNPPPEPPARTIFERRSTTIRDDQEEDEASDSRDSRYGEHYLDSREERRRKPVKAEEKAETPTKPTAEKPVAEAHPDSLPGTVLIFKDGHRSEIHDYAIVGENLFDLGTVHIMKKIPLAMLDLPATRKENELNGVDFRLP